MVIASEIKSQLGYITAHLAVINNTGAKLTVTKLILSGIAHGNSLSNGTPISAETTTINSM